MWKMESFLWLVKKIVETMKWLEKQPFQQPVGVVL